MLGMSLILLCVQYRRPVCHVYTVIIKKTTFFVVAFIQVMIKHTVDVLITKR